MRFFCCTRILRGRSVFTQSHISQLQISVLSVHKWSQCGNVLAYPISPSVLSVRRMASKTGPERKAEVTKVQTGSPGSGIAKEDEVTVMRTRLRELHGLNQRGQCSKFAPIKAASHVVNDETNPDSSYSDGDTVVVSENSDYEFISRIGKLEVEDDADVHISMPFGLIRFDSMNKAKTDAEQQIDSACDTSNVRSAMRAGNVLDHANFNLDTEKCKNVPSVTKNQKLNSTLNSNVTNSDGIIQNPPLSDQDTVTGNIGSPLQKNTSSQEYNVFDIPFDSLLPAESQKPNGEPVTKCTSAQDDSRSDAEYSIFDQQYFNNKLSVERNDCGNLDLQERLPCDLATEATSTKHATKSSSGSHSTEMNFFDQQFFGTHSSKQLENSENSMAMANDSYTQGPQSLSYFQKAAEQNQFRVVRPLQETSEEIRKPSTKPSSKTSPTLNLQYVSDSSSRVLNQSELHDAESDTVIVEPVTKREIKSFTRPFADVSNPKTAYDLAVKLRLQRAGKLGAEQDTPNKSGGHEVHPRESKWSGQTDSKGFRILKDQVININHLTQDDLVSILKDSVIFEDEKLLVIDKPYGLPSHGGPGVHNSVGRLLEPLAERIDKSGRLQRLHLVHRLDKETTGVMILAKSLQIAEFLLAMFKQRQVIKHYWVITKGIPNPTEGVIDIPIGEGLVGNKYRMELKPIYSSEGKLIPGSSSLDDRFEAITNYRVLSSCNGAALVECTPETGVKHQIRCHLAFGLNTPIIGDHKYSHYSKIAPQRLYPELLQRLGVRQTKVRHIPMHLHAKAVVLPEWVQGRNLFLSARLPKHFAQNMKWLQLKPPS